MVITILEARVEEKDWQTLQATYKLMTQVVPPEIKISYLAQDQSDNSLWRILTIWENQEALDAMRASGQIPTGVAIFQKVQATPKLTVYDIQGATG